MKLSKEDNQPSENITVSDVILSGTSLSFALNNMSNKMFCTCSLGEPGLLIRYVNGHWLPVPCDYGFATVETHLYMNKSGTDVGVLTRFFLGRWMDSLQTEAIDLTEICDEYTENLAVGSKLNYTIDLYHVFGHLENGRYMYIRRFSPLGDTSKITGSIGLVLTH